MLKHKQAMKEKLEALLSGDRHKCNVLGLALDAGLCAYLIECRHDGWFLKYCFKSWPKSKITDIGDDSFPIEGNAHGYSLGCRRYAMYDKNTKHGKLRFELAAHILKKLKETD